MANELGYRISSTGGFRRKYASEVWLKATGAAHAQSGISSDIGNTPGARLPCMAMNRTLSPICKTVAPHHAFIMPDQRHSDAGTKPSSVTAGAVQLLFRRVQSRGCGNLPPMSAATICACHRLARRACRIWRNFAPKARARIPPLGEEAARNTRILERTATRSQP